MASRDAEKLRRDQMRRGGEARNRAIKRILEKYHTEFLKIYEEEALKLGITPFSIRRRKKIDRLKSEIQKLQSLVV